MRDKFSHYDHVMSTYRNRLATNFQAQTIAAPVKIPLITLLLLCLSLGCGKEEDVGESAASAPVTLKTEPEEETKKPEPPNAEPKVEVKKLLTKEESAKVIEAVIRKAAKKPVGELTKSDLEKVTELDLRNKQLTDAKSLEDLTQLTHLYLRGNQLTEVKGLEKLTQLKRLVLNENQLTDVKGLEKLTQLTRLELGYNPDLTKAQVAELQKALPDCKIFSDYPLTKEESAKVIESAIRKELKKPTGELTKTDLDKVTRLDLHDNQLTDVKGLEKLTQLTTLYLMGNNLRGCEKSGEPHAANGPASQEQSRPHQASDC